MTFQGDLMPWKLSLRYDMEKLVFLLFINDKSFFNLQYQADVDPAGPQNIKKGKIYINGTMVHDGFKHYDD